MSLPLQTELKPENADIMRALSSLHKKIDELSKTVKTLQEDLNWFTSPSFDDVDRGHAHQGSSKSFMLRNVSFGEVQKACDGWTKPLGSGGFGDVYKGVWNGQDIAVKRLRSDKASLAIKGKIVILLSYINLARYNLLYYA